MELSVGGSLALILCLYLSVITEPASASKCRGEWAIHACFGGNGKRSDPSVEPGMLHKVLFSNARNLDRIFQSENVARPEEEMPAYDDEGTKADSDDIYPRQTVLVAPESRDFRRYLVALKLQQALRSRDRSLI
ncbi:hypothetical protein BsWGS_28050 [Bradybaena similaris]